MWLRWNLGHKVVVSPWMLILEIHIRTILFPQIEMDSSNKNNNHKIYIGENKTTFKMLQKSASFLKKSKFSDDKWKKCIELNDLIGDFGLYQLNVIIFTLVRMISFYIDSLIFSLSLPRNIDFQCASSSANHTKSFDLPLRNIDSRCYFIDENSSNTVKPCQKWIYLNPEHLNTLTVQWDLVCHREWLGSLLLTIFFVGRFFGNAVWGYLADKFGRRNSHTLCHLGGLIFGVASIFSPSVYWLILFRFGSAFCGSGFNCLNTLLVEIVGTKYRTLSTMIIHIGWGFGIISLAFVGLTTNNWRHFAAIGPVMMFLSLPWLFVLPESIRWLILQRKWDAAREEIRRGAICNGLPREETFDLKINEYLKTRALEDEKRSEASMFDLLKNRVLCLNLMSLCLTALLSSFIYWSRTLDFAPDKSSIMANFIISGAGLWLCLLIAGCLMYIFERKTCLATFTCGAGLSFLIEGIIRHTSQLLVTCPTLAYFLDATAKISAMSGTMVIVLVSFEVFPTELRNRGSSLILNALSIGSISAPFYKNIIQLVDGKLNYSIILALAGIVVTFFLLLLVSETKDKALTETISDYKPTNENSSEKTDDLPTQRI